MIFNFIVKNLYVYFPGRNILFKFYLKHYAPPCTLCEVVLVSTWSMSQGITQDTETLTLDQLHLRSSSTPSAMCNQTSLNLTGDMFSLFIPISLNLGLKKSDEVRCIGPTIKHPNFTWCFNFTWSKVLTLNTTHLV